jgi:hypothetical protein
MQNYFNYRQYASTGFPNNVLYFKILKLIKKTYEQNNDEILMYKSTILLSMKLLQHMAYPEKAL